LFRENRGRKSADKADKYVLIEGVNLRIPRTKVRGSSFLE